MSKSSRKLVNKKKIVHKFPPSVSLLPTQTMVFRFISTTPNGQTIFRRSLLSLIMAQGVANVLISVIQSVRLKKVEVWGAPLTADINYSTVSLEWEDPRGNFKVISDSGTTSEPGHLVCKPPKDTTAQMWSSFNTIFVNEPLFFLIVPTGGIIDVTVNCIFANGSTAGLTYITRTNVNTVLGNYYLSLDNSSSAGGAGTTGFVPLPSILTTVPTS